MKESDIRAELGRLLRRHWFWPIVGTDAFKCEKCGHVTRPKKGRPDIPNLNPSGPSVVVEVKVFPRDAGAFPFARITPDQRQWLSNWNRDTARETYTGMYVGGAYLGIGTVTGKAGSKKSPRYLWLPPWDNWLEIEGRLREVGQVSLPLMSHRGQKKIIQELGLSALELLAPWQLVWEIGQWHLPPEHPLRFVNLGGERDLEKENKRWKRK